MLPLIASIAAPLISQVMGDAAQKLLPGPLGQLASTALSSLQSQQGAAGAGAGAGPDLGAAAAGTGLLGELLGKVRISF